MKKPARATSETSATELPWVTSTAGTVLTAITVICVIGVITLIATPQPAAREDVVRPVESNPPSRSVTTWPKPEAKKTAAPKPPQPAALSPEASAAHLPITHVPAAEPPPPPVTIPTAKWPLPGPTEKVEVQASAVTITGCLALDDEGFRLKDTDGVDAPKSRSWKSGFLTRRPAAVELLDPGNTVKLSTYVGHRVAATGTLTDREMQVRSVRRVTTAPCS